MPRSDKPLVIDGLSSVRAARRAHDKTGKGSSRPARARAQTEPAARPAPAEDRSRRVSRTAMPARHEIRCYQCGYAFVMRGRLQKTYCPKCRITLDVSDHTIDGDWSGEIKTIGSVEVLSGAHLTGGEIMATEVVLAGRAAGANVRACHRLILCPGARVDISTFTAQDVIVRGGGPVTVEGEVLCRDLEVLGELDARVRTQGVLTIRAGGVLMGEAHCPHLVVEEGGGLRARVIAGAPANTQQSGKGVGDGKKKRPRSRARGTDQRSARAGRA